MKTCRYLRLLAIAVWTLALSATAQPPHQAWVNRYSLAPNKTNQTTAIAIASDGSIIVGGSSANASNDLDYVFIKYAPNGMQQWLNRYDSPTNGNDQMAAMTLDKAGNVLATGSSKTVKVDTNGTGLWNASYAGKSIAADFSNNVIVTGFSPIDFATVKLNAAGSNQWVRTYDLSGKTDVSQVVTTDHNGNVYVSGFETWICNPWCYRHVRTIKYDSIGSEVWSSYIVTGQASTDNEATAIFVDSSGYTYVVGDEGPTRANYVTAKLNSDGNTLWWWYLDRDGPAAYYANCRGMVMDEAGNSYLTGSLFTEEAINVYCTVKIDTDGQKVWIKQYQGSAEGQNIGTAIALDSAGNVYVTGYSPGTGSGNDIVTIKYDNNGNEKWVVRYNGPANGDDLATGLVVDADANIYVTGYSATSAGGTEFVTIKYTQENLKLEKQANGVMRLQVTTAPGQIYGLEASTNLQTWLPLTTNTADPNGLIQFDDTNALTIPIRFYRGNSSP